MSLASPVVILAVALVADGPPALESQLRSEDPAALARDARTQGDAARGALVFFRPGLSCASCHDAEDGRAPLGPDLARRGRDVTDLHLVEAVLEPSKEVARGYETVTIATADGRALAGLLAEDRPDAVVLRDPARGGKPVTIPKSAIEERRDGGPSLMPAGLVNQLASRGEFLDLVRYLRAIADGGPGRARALRPDPALIRPPLPAYEADLDHAGLIAGLDGASFDRGAAIYARVCANCHGTKDRPGSLPNSPRFASATFKNGSDPLSLYRTLTLGFGQMAPQTWMVPRQKYDVIHYLREAYLKEDNPSRYVRVDGDYLAKLPKGTTRGPEPTSEEPWAAMDYGPSLMATIEVGDDGSNFAFKGIAVRLDAGPGGVARGRHWALYDHDTMRLAAAWSGDGFLDWNGINFNGQHQVHPRVVGRVHVANPAGPGWADPRTGVFEDRRPRGRDDRPYGPLPRAWARYKGLYHHGDRVLLSYSVGEADVLELPGLEVDPDGAPVFTRTLEVGPAPHELLLKVAPEEVAAAVVGDRRARLVARGGSTLLRLPASETSRTIKILMASGEQGKLDAFATTSPPPVALTPLTSGGPSRWPDVLTTTALPGRADGPFAVDALTIPEVNPWSCLMRPSGLDFLDDGRRAAVCTWDGDVWLVAGLDDPAGRLSWRRVASGLFQPLGLKVRDGAIYVACRDQIAVLRDRNGDGEANFLECFNDDHQVTDHFHEFAMDLQADAEGNLYYARAARHGLEAVVPQHGTLLRVSRDGRRTDILATGFRAPNGVCLNPDGSFFLTDQEGFWTPKNRINLVKPGGFYGNMWGYHDVTDTSDAAMEPPVCWITNAFDRSPGAMVWVTSDAWGPLKGSVLNLSYGEGKLFVVPYETVDGRAQGGMCALPIPPLPTGVMRGRFGPRDGQLYACGLFAWAGNRTRPGGFYRIRYTGKPLYLPIALHARRAGMEITFTSPLDPKTAADPARYAVKTWSLRRSAEYGSPHHNERPSQVLAATPSEDGRRVLLTIADFAPAQGMEITYSVRGQGGEAVEGVIDNTVHRLGD